MQHAGSRASGEKGVEDYVRKICQIGDVDITITIEIDIIDDIVRAELDAVRSGRRWKIIPGAWIGFVCAWHYTHSLS